MEDYKTEKHYVTRSNWLRAAVLGANDGIISVASLAIGVAAASESRDSIILATLASLVAGALSMAAGEYVSVSSQTDTEQADLERERKELENQPEFELKELAQTYKDRGVDDKTAFEVARQLTAHNALEAHAREELGINEITKPNPLQAALASGASFTCGGMLPFGVSVFFPVQYMVYGQYGFAIVFLIFLGAVSAKTGGSSIAKGVWRITLWGTIAMVLTAVVGHLFDVNVA